jgi:hypothetical protein
MAAKKKPLKKQKKSKRSIARKAAPKKTTPKKMKAKKKQTASAKNAVRKPVSPKKQTKKKKTAERPIAVSTKPVRKPSQTSSRGFSRDDEGSSSGGQSGDLQGLSRREGADSESVEELIEEGNAFEADVVTGVEEAGEDDEREVHTHEVPEDDVPDEYLDQD